MANYYPATALVESMHLASGAALVGGTLSAFLSGTSTATNMFTDKNGTVGGSIITLNSRGEPEVSGSAVVIWLDDDIEYKFVLKNSSGSTIWTVDGYSRGLDNIPKITNVSPVFDTVAAMKASTTFVTAGLTVKTKGYTTAGDSGHAEYLIKTSGDYGSTPDEYGDHTLSNGNVAVLQTGRYLNPLQFGAVGDNSTDDYAALNACCATGSPVDGGELRYKINTPLVSTSREVKLKLNGSSVTATTEITEGVNSKAIFVMKGGDFWATGYTTTTLSSAGTRGDDTIAVTSASDIQAGDTLLLYQDTKWHTSTDVAATGKKSEMVQVDSVSGTTVTLANRLQGTYTTSCTVRRMERADRPILNLDVIGNGTGSQQVGVVCIHTVNPTLNIKVDSCEDVGLACYENYRPVINLNASNCNRDGLGYGVDISGSSNVSIMYLSTANCRHPITGGAGFSPQYILSRNISVCSYAAEGCRDSIFDMHPGAVDVTVGNIVGTMRDSLTSSGDGWVFQGSRLQAGNISVSNFDRHGVLVQYFGDGDGIPVHFSFGDIYVEGTSTSQKGFIVDNLSDGDDIDSLNINSINGQSQSGCAITATEGDINNISILAGSYEALANDHGLLLQATASGEINEVKLGGSFKCPATASYYSVYSQGYDATYQVTNVKMFGPALIGGDYGIRCDQGNVKFTMGTFTGQATGNTVTGTGGTITEIT